jgi:transposase
MPAESVSMQKIRDVLPLTFELKKSRRRVSEATGIGRTAVTDYVQRVGAAGLGWPLPEGLDNADLERRLVPQVDTSKSLASTEPDWATIHAEMKRRGVTLTLL